MPLAIERRVLMRNDDDGGPEQPRSSGGQGWLQTLRQRLGLSGPQTLRDTLEEALKTEDHAETAFSAAERDMLLRLLRFGALRVDDVMVPRADIIAIDETAPILELLQRFREAGVSRIPIYHETLDDPRGMVHIKDLMRFLMGDVAPREAGSAELGKIDLTRADVARPITGARLRRPMLYVPPSMPAMNLMIRMQSTRIHMALVSTNTAAPMASSRSRIWSSRWSAKSRTSTTSPRPPTSWTTPSSGSWPRRALPSPSSRRGSASSC